MARKPTQKPRRTPAKRKPAQTQPGVFDAGLEALEGVTDPVQLATLTLQAICKSEAPASARAQAARTLLELHGALARGQTQNDALASELSASELDARIEALTDTPDTRA